MSINTQTMEHKPYKSDSSEADHNIHKMFITTKQSLYMKSDSSEAVYNIQNISYL
jgi:hypothetical protein